MSLKVYKEKRDFKKTPEPGTGKNINKSLLTFVIQRHAATHLHYDLRLEMDGVLKSWAVPKGPSMNPGDKRLAIMVEDHPLDYGKFYGEIPKGNYGAGVVEIWDNGTYKPIEEKGNPEKKLLSQLSSGNLKFILKGTHLKGAFALVRLDHEKNEWLLIKKEDEFAVHRDFDIESVLPLKTTKKLKAAKEKKLTSGSRRGNSGVKSKSSGEKQSFPAVLPLPMLAKLSRVIIDNPDWLYEMKIDGYRMICGIHDGKVEMISRNGNNFNVKYGALAEELKIIEEDVILDGEMVIENTNGISNFQLLQNYGTTREGTLKYYVFDLLYLNGHSIVDFPLIKRKELLEAFFSNYKFRNIHNVEYHEGNGKALFEELSTKGYEGIIAKAPQSIYMPAKRTDAWLKVKASLMQEAVIFGYTMPQKSRKYFGSVILGLYEGGKLRYIGNCGTGFNDASLRDLHAKFEHLKAEKPPVNPVPKFSGTKAVWLSPVLVCNVKFLEWSNEGHMRHPVFMGLREDKKASEVVNDSKEELNDNAVEKTIEISGKKVKCTNLTKIYWPGEGYTKGDLIAYYQSVSSYILPYLRNRPQSLNRHPNGIAGKSFYHKDMNVEQIPKWVKTVQIYSKSNDAPIDYLICNDPATLIYMANLGCIEINPWHSTYMKPEEPAYFILDLDPGNISFTDVVNTALVIKEICDEISIPCICKTSGATGLHIYVPLVPRYNYDQVKTLAEIMANIAHNRLPATTSIERSVSKRKDKVYIDFLQNRKGQTIAAPYSVRPQPNATVSAPLLWKEVNHQLTPQLFTIATMKKRIDKVGDLWQGVTQKGIVLSNTLKALEKLL